MSRKPQPTPQPPQLSPARRNAIIQTRVSRDAQTEGTSPEVQLAACMKKAQAENCAVTHVFEESISGALYRARPDMQEALRLIEAGAAQVLIVPRLDRAGRDVDALRDIKRRIERAGGEMMFADGLQVQPGAVGNLLYNQLASFAEFERELIRERMVSGLRARAEQGIQVARTTPPYGYHIVQHADVIRKTHTPEQVGQYELVPEQAKWIKPLWEHYVAGHSLRATCDWLNRQGVPTPRGNRVWGTSTLTRMLRNRVYKGQPSYSATERMVDESRAARGLGIDYERPRPESEWIPLSAPALVSEALWQEAFARLEAGRQERSGRTDRKRLFTGLGRCPQCGRRLQATTTRGRQPAKRITLYRCGGGQRRARADALTCVKTAYAGKTLETLVLDALREGLSDPALFPGAEREYLRQLAQDKTAQHDKQELKRLERELVMLQHREEAGAEGLVDARLRGSDGNAFRRLLETTEARRREVEAAIEALQARQARGALQRGVVDRADLTELLAALQDARIAEVERGSLLARFVERVYPQPCPPELSHTARQARIAAGELEGALLPVGSKESRRAVGGVDIVLRTARPGPVYILSRHLVEKIPTRDTSGRLAFERRFETTLRIVADDPLPVINYRRGTSEIQNQLL